ncbi:hypothetical protein [Vibrio phage LP.1]|nr:hypothetical protein [Vibrio phage LP.1]
MPARPGKTPRHVKQEYAEFVGRMTGPRTKAAIAKVLSIGMTGAKQYAPLEYGTLMNSAFRRIEGSRMNWRGIAGFTVYYSFYLHQRMDWNPRPPDKKAGPAWNPNARPKFLELGFTAPDQITLMQKALGEEYRKL